MVISAIRPKVCFASLFLISIMHMIDICTCIRCLFKVLFVEISNGDQIFQRMYMSIDMR